MYSKNSRPAEPGWSAVWKSRTRRQQKGCMSGRKKWICSTLELLQEFVFVALDIFRKNQHNKGIRNKLDAWLAFFSIDDPEVIVDLVEKYPYFRSMYEEVYEMCRNTEKVMNMFSKELRELDRNTVYD